jgi:hypothetical protein
MNNNNNNNNNIRVEDIITVKNVKLLDTFIRDQEDVVEGPDLSAETNEDELEELNVYGFDNPNLIQAVGISFVLKFDDADEFKANLKQILTGSLELEEDAVLNDEDVQYVYDLLRALYFTNITIVAKENKLKFQYGNRKSAVQDKASLKLKLKKGRIMFLDKLEDDEIIKLIETKYPKKVKDGELLHGVFSQGYKYKFIEAAKEIVYTFKTIREVVDLITNIYFVNSGLLPKAPYGDKILGLEKEDFESLYRQFSFYSSFNEIVAASLLEYDKKLLGNKREREEVIYDIGLEWNQSIERIIIDTLHANKAEFIDSFNDYFNQIGLVSNATYKSMIQNLDTNFSIFCGNIGEIARKHSKYRHIENKSKVKVAKKKLAIGNNWLQSYCGLASETNNRRAKQYLKEFTEAFFKFNQNREEEEDDLSEDENSYN